QPGEADQVFLGDSMGELMQFYACADLAFVGGSLIPGGGHNYLEPAALGLPVLSGPHRFNFAEISQLLEQAGRWSRWRMPQRWWRRCRPGWMTRLRGSGQVRRAGRWWRPTRAPWSSCCRAFPDCSDPQNEV